MHVETLKNLKPHLTTTTLAAFGAGVVCIFWASIVWVVAIAGLTLLCVTAVRLLLSLLGKRASSP